MMKKIKYLILILCFSFMISGCAKQKEEVEPKSSSTPLLFEVSKEGATNKIYLFGSIHAADESLYPLPDYVLNAYHDSDAIAVEFDLVAYAADLSNQVELLSKFVYPDAKTISEDLDKETYEKGVEILKTAGLYYSMMDSYTPIMWESLIENVVMINTGLSEQYGIDTHFLNLAKEDNKKIIELESADYQYSMLLGFDMDLQIYLLKESINRYEESQENMKKLYDLYKKGNQNDLESLLFEEGETNAYLEEYNNQLITVRNNNMTASLKESFQNGETVFCTVGLGHIIGEGGIVDLLSQEGYKVTVVK